MVHISKIKSSLDKALGEVGYERKTYDVKYHCPKCKHHKQKLEVNIKSGAYHCWVCNFKGIGIPSLVKNVSSNENLYREAVSLSGETEKRIKAEKSSSIFSNNIIAPETILAKLPDGFIPLRHKQLTRSWRVIYNYAKKTRKFSDIEILRYNMGYVEHGDLKDRLIIPSYDRDGNLNYFSARSVYDDVFLKYINSDAPKDDIVGFENFIDFKQPITVVEGALDAVSIGFNAIPLFGKTLSSLLKLRIVENKTPLVRIMLDDDAFSDSVKMSEKLNKLGVDNRIIKMSGKDSNEIGRLKSLELLETSSIELDFKKVLEYRMN